MVMIMAYSANKPSIVLGQGRLFAEVEPNTAFGGCHRHSVTRPHNICV